MKGKSKKSAKPTKAPKKQVKKVVKVSKPKAQEYTYCTLHWIAINNNQGEMVGLFSRDKGSVFSMISVMREAMNRLKSQNVPVVNVTLKNFFEVPRQIAELYLKEKDSFEVEVNESLVQLKKRIEEHKQQMQAAAEEASKASKAELKVVKEEEPKLEKEPTMAEADSMQDMVFTDAVDEAAVEEESESDL